MTLGKIPVLFFLLLTEKRIPDKIENWLKTLSCKSIRFDGTKPIQENVELIKGLYINSPINWNWKI